MLRRFYLISMLVTALAAGAAVTATAVEQKDKQKEKATTKEQKDKETYKTWSLSGDANRAFFAMPFGDSSYLGVYLEEVTAERVKELGLGEERGAIVMKVVEGGPGEKAGLKENDVVVGFNGRRVDSVRELQRLLSETPSERSISIEVIRAGSRQTLNATLTKRSQEFRLLGPEMNEEGLKADTEAMKRAGEALKRSQETLKREREKLRAMPPDFGNFAFVTPGQFGFFSGSRLGVSVESLTDQLAEYFGVKDGGGVLVAHVEDNSAAAKAGLKAGDVIIAIDNEKIDSVNALVKAVAKKQEGSVAVKILRNRSEQTVTVALEKRQQVPATRRRASVAAAAVSAS